jgi:hypothetical protein
MKHSLFLSIALALLGAGNASAASILFNSDPFLGSDALVTPGRQVVGNEPFISFDPLVDQFVFDQAVFGFTNPIDFANGPVGSLPTSGLDVVVLQSFDDDGDVATPFGAGNAANLIADQVTSDRSGAFVYFNSGLNLPRLVYSTNLSDPTSDLKVLARMTNLAGNPAGLGGFSAGNFAVQESAVPEPETWMMLLLGFGAIGNLLRATRRRRQTAAVSYA